MRLLISIAALGFAVASLRAEDDAEKRFHAMQQEIRAAKTLQCRVDLVITDALGKKWNVKGTVAFGEGDRLRIDADGKMFGEAVRFTVISDGRTLTETGDAGPQGDQKSKRPANGIGAYFRDRFSQNGLLETLLQMDDGKKPAPKNNKAPMFQNFKLAGKETINGQETRVVTFERTIRNNGDEADRLQFAVWIAEKTGLPVKRTMSGGQSDVRDLTESYSEFAIGRNLDARLFVPGK